MLFTRPSKAIQSGAVKYMPLTNRRGRRSVVKLGSASTGKNEDQSR